MPASVPTNDEFQAAMAGLQAQLDTLQAEADYLEDRVAALEAGAGETPPDPEEPPPDVEEPPDVEPPPVITTGRAVTISLGGQHHVFTQEDGTDLGDYVDPEGRFVQHCIASRCDTLPDFTVMFRPDADGKREEVVFEFGRCHNNADQQYNGNPAGTMGAYTVTIKQDATTLATIDVPCHYFYSRWRWQSAPRPVTTTAKDLIDRKLVPNLDKSLVPNLRATVHTDDGPMRPNGITAYMAQTGERDDIGILTESQADYLMYEDAQSLQTIRAWVEGSAAFPWHERDEQTLAPLNFVDTYPQASSREGGYGTPQLPTYYTYEEALWPDTSHAPDCGYVPFLLTGDPYALEELQFATTYDNVSQSGTKDFCMSQSLRSYAWHMRNVAHCTIATPDNVPKWLHPKAYWQTYLDRALAYSVGIGPHCAADTWQQRFRDISVGVNTGGEVSCLMEEYTMAVYLHMVDLGLTGWDELRDWKIAGDIARTDGVCGYNRSIPIAYVRHVTAGSPAAPVHEDWSDLWQWNEANDPYYSGADPTQRHLAASAELGYCTYMAGILNWARRQGVPDVEPSRDWLGAEMAGRWAYMRWAVA